MGKQEHLSLGTGRSSSSSRFKITNLSTDPFALSTLLVGILSWIIAFAGSVASGISESFPRFTWWGLVFELLLLVALFLFYGFDLIDQYKSFLTSGFAIAFIYTTNSTTNLVYSDGSKKATAAAGVILLSMINLIWVFYYGGDNTSPVNQWIDSFSLKGPRNSTNPFYRQSYTPGGAYSAANTNTDDYRSSSNNKYVSSTRLQGLENFSEREASSPMYNLGADATHVSAETELSGTNEFGLDSNLVIDDFPYTARALYSYESSPEDENEISFEKGEILKVNDIHSRWWQAKRSNGEIGICPSNYVELIE